MPRFIFLECLDNYVFKNFVLINFISGFLGTFIIFLYIISIYSNQEVNLSLTAIIVLACTMFSFIWCLPTAQITSLKFDPFHPGSLFFIFYLFYTIFSGLIVWLLNDYSSKWVDFGFNYASLVNQAFILATRCAFFAGTKSSYQYKLWNIHKEYFL